MTGSVVGLTNGGGTTVRRAWLRFSGLVVLAACITAIVAYKSLQASSLNGRLCIPPIYDDVAYFIDAVRWRDGLAGRSLAGNLLNLLHQHAPFSTLVAAIGFRLVPDSYTGPYLVNAALVFAFLLAIVWLTWKRSFHQIATCLFVAACVPALWHTVAEGRPDLPWGLALGIAVGAVVARDVLSRNASALIVLGAGSGLAASIKPTAFPASMAFLGSLFALRLLLDCMQTKGLRASSRAAIRALLCFALPLLAVIGLLLGPSLVDTIKYIFNVFVTQRDLWTSGEGFWVGLQYFLVGPGGKAGLNFWLWIGLLLMTARILLATTMGRGAVHDAAVLLAAVVIAYAIPSVAEIKTYFFGAIFYGTFIVAMVLNFCEVQTQIESRIMTKCDGVYQRGLMDAIRFMPLAAIALLFVKMVIIGPVSPALWINEQQQHEIRTATESVWTLVREATLDQSAPPIVAFSGAYPVAPGTIKLYGAQAHIDLDVRSELFHRTLEQTEKALLAATILVISSSIQHTLTGPRLGDELIRKMDANKDVCLLATQTFPDVTLRVYRRGC
ncbi:glycosyltransferase family 39 protein [Bradyrhizobium sp. BR 10289]|uniref:glycosyltransferase family 39 protein n=1 Tax=Bradyrhizobium sp. BR 10289 TaxID=2749993 RepID=UPI001C650BE3|nr:glycosyltransferase family 39 protein [Bradyrhizobium sp. BR 10289]MBW7972708.1 hypothetical protein [Bradyrhizobium sp. BR 10289]